MNGKGVMLATASGKNQVGGWGLTSGDSHTKLFPISNFLLLKYIIILYK